MISPPPPLDSKLTSAVLVRILRWASSKIWFQKYFDRFYDGGIVFEPMSSINLNESNSAHNTSNIAKLLQHAYIY